MAAPLPAPASYAAGSPSAPGGDPTAVFRRRVLAAIIDVALFMIPAIILLTGSFEYLDVADLDREPQAFCDDYMDEVGGFCANTADIDDRVYFADDLDPVSTIVFWGGSFALLVLLQGLTGRTPGKLLTGIRTVREDGSPPGIGKALVRWVLLIVDGQPCGLPVVGFICGLTTQGHRRVGDMAARTFVVRASAAGAPISVPGLTAPLGPPADYGSPAYGTPGYGTPGYGTPGYGSPTAGAWGSAPPAAAPAPSADGPQWDAARNTYIQWDPSSRRWLQWDDSARTWTPIPGQ
jgi:uncharacterized RDD family membrane protein YckC